VIPRDVKDWLREELFDQVPMAVAVIDRDFRIVEANYAFGEAYGDWEGRNCWEVYKGRTEQCASCNAKRTFGDGAVRVREEEGVPKNGDPSYYLCHVVPVIQPGGAIPYVIEMSTDITKTKTLEREKLEVERLAAVGQTVAGLAHGIKNIIMGLEGGMYVVNSGIRKGDAQRAVRGWRMLEEDIARISTFVKDFLSFARGRTPTVAFAGPNEIAREVILLFRDRAAAEGVTLIADFQEVDACLMSDGDDHKVVVKTREERGTIVYEVTDNGVGMEYEIKKKVFTSFFSTKASGQGTGLGLLTTRKIIQEHGGSVSFDSTEGEGSTFKLELPRGRLPVPASGEEE